MLEHAIRFNLIKRRLQETLFLQLIVVVVGHRRELLRFFIKEFKVGGTLILDLIFILGFSSPLIFVTPLFLVFFIVIGCIFEVVFFLSFLAVWYLSVVAQGKNGAKLTLQSGRKGLEQTDDALKETRPPLLYTDWHILTLESQERTYS